MSDRYIIINYLLQVNFRGSLPPAEEASDDNNVLHKQQREHTSPHSQARYYC